MDVYETIQNAIERIEKNPSLQKDLSDSNYTFLYNDLFNDGASTTAFLLCTGLSLNTIMENLTKKIPYKFLYDFYTWSDNALNEFLHLRGLHIKIPNNIAIIDEYAFAYNPISKIDLPKGIFWMGKGVFKNTKINEIKFPPNLSRIPSECCSNCHQLQTIHIPSSVIEIFQDAFADVNPDADVYYEGTSDDWKKVKKQNDWWSINTLVWKNNNTITIHCKDGDVTEHTS